MKCHTDKGIMSRSAVLYVTLTVTISVLCVGSLLSNAVVYCVFHSSHSCIFKLEVLSSQILKADTLPLHLSQP